MRSVFLQYSSNNNDNIDGQIKQLNTTVLDYAVPQVHNELVSYIKYKRDISVHHLLCNCHNLWRLTRRWS